MRLFVSLLLLSGCAMVPTTTTIDASRAPPAGWPNLTVTVIHTTESDVARRCSATKMIEAWGCTLPQFQTGRCFILIAKEDSSVLEHEKMHCLGYDHPGESTMRDAWAKWKAGS